MDNKNPIPNLFYDLIAFLTPTIVLAVGLVIGFSSRFNFAEIVKGVSAIGWVFAILGFVTISYGYGRAIEVWSASFVQKPIFILQEKLGWPKDLGFSWAPDVNELGLPTSLTGDAAKNRWTFYFLAFHIDSAIGSDLLKRYAWEKAARSDSLSYMFLALGSLGYRLYATLAKTTIEPGIFGFGSFIYSGVAAFAAIACAAEYYRRNNWNMDLLHKIAPVLQFAVNGKKEQIEVSVTKNINNVISQ